MVCLLVAVRKSSCILMNVSRLRRARSTIATPGVEPAIWPLTAFVMISFSCWAKLRKILWASIKLDAPSTASSVRIDAGDSPLWGFASCRIFNLHFAALQHPYKYMIIQAICQQLSDRLPHCVRRHVEHSRSQAHRSTPTLWREE